MLFCVFRQQTRDHHRPSASHGSERSASDFAAVASSLEGAFSPTETSHGLSHGQGKCDFMVVLAWNTAYADNRKHTARSRLHRGRVETSEISRQTLSEHVGKRRQKDRRLRVRRKQGTAQCCGIAHACSVPPPTILFCGNQTLRLSDSNMPADNRAERLVRASLSTTLIAVSNAP